MYRPPSPSKSHSFLGRSSPQASSPSAASLSHAALPFSAASPAQRGAVLAFSSPPPLAPKPNLSTSPGALAAAVKVGSSSPAVPSSSPATVGGSGGNGRNYSLIAGRGAMQRNGSSEATAGAAGAGSRTQSPSHIAATRAAAASRAGKTPSESPAVNPLPRRTFAPPRRQSTDEEEGKDESHIPETSSLVQLFEAKTTAVRRQATAGTPKAETKRAVTIGSRPTGIISPIPLRPRPMSLEVKAEAGLPNLASPEAAKSPRPPPPKRMFTDATLRRHDAKVAAQEDSKSIVGVMTNPDRTTSTIKDPPTVPPPRRAKTQTKPSKPAETPSAKPAPTVRREIPDLLTGSPPPPSADGPLSPLSAESVRSPGRYQAPVLEPTPPRPKPTVDPPKPRPISAAPAPPPPRSSRTASRPQLPPLATTTAVPTLPSPGPLRPQRSGPTRSRPGLASSLTPDTLASAIVASSLASSRGPSPAPRPALPPRHPSSPASAPATDFTHLLARPAAPTSRAPSPLKPTTLRQTLRRRASSASELQPDARLPSRSRSPPKRPGSSKPPKDERFRQHHHAFLVKRHPNKHAEGARRRWQDAVGEAARRRYEGVWASNRGLLMHTLASAEESVPGWAAAVGGDEAPGQRVHALVVRDVWSRSGLGAARLAEIWELVRGGGRGEGEREAWKRRSLRRDEFVVGMWLVDQCLTGRKLPVEVSESVWASVRGLVGGLAAR